jgi:hypothetical protein
MDTSSIYLLASVALGFLLAQIPKARDEFRRYVSVREREADRDMLRMRQCLNTLEYWLGEQADSVAKGWQPPTARRYTLMRAYVRQVLGLAPLPEDAPAATEARSMGAGA